MEEASHSYLGSGADGNKGLLRKRAVGKASTSSSSKNEAPKVAHLIHMYFRFIKRAIRAGLHYYLKLAKQKQSCYPKSF